LSNNNPATSSKVLPAIYVLYAFLVIGVLYTRTYFFLIFRHSVSLVTGLIYPSTSLILYTDSLDWHRGILKLAACYYLLWQDFCHAYLFLLMEGRRKELCEHRMSYYPNLAFSQHMSGLSTIFFSLLRCTWSHYCNEHMFYCHRRLLEGMLQQWVKAWAWIIKDVL
jgi:hypothetical protein